MQTRGQILKNGGDKSVQFIVDSLQPNAIALFFVILFRKKRVS